MITTAGRPVPGEVLDNQYKHNFLFGVRYAFNVAAATPVAAGRAGSCRRRLRRARTWYSSIGTRRR